MGTRFASPITEMSKLDTKVDTSIFPKRTSTAKVVLVTAAGQHVIVGCLDDPQALKEIPSYLPPEQCGFPQGASLIKHHRNALYYREITVPKGLGRFDKRQR